MPQRIRERRTLENSPASLRPRGRMSFATAIVVTSAAAMAFAHVERLTAAVTGGFDRWIRSGPGGVRQQVWDENRNSHLWSHKINPQALGADVQRAKPSDRGRVRIMGGTVVTESGLRLRGEHLRVAETGHSLQRSLNLARWVELAERFHLNTVRVLLYRPPQNWKGGAGDKCFPIPCFRSPQDAFPYVDAMVEIASDMGMYVILDYHPVGGYHEQDAMAWWNELAPRYKDRTHVIYEMCNEPVRWSAGAYDADDIRFEEELYRLIRSHAFNTHIIAWSFATATGPGEVMLNRVRSASRISYENASVAYHPYQEYNEAELKALRAAGYPIVATEVGGAPRSEYVERTNAAEKLAVSWIWLDGTGMGKPWAKNPLAASWPKDPKSGRPTVATPRIEPNGGSGLPVRVKLETTTLGATIRYTTDGNQPTKDSPEYTEPFLLQKAALVKAKAFKRHYIDSAAATASYATRQGG